VILVLDTSGSMESAGRIGKLRSAASWVINTLSKYDHAAVVSYATAASSYPLTGEMMKMDTVGRAKMKEHLKQLNANGNTNMEAGIQMGFDIMAKSKRAKKSSSCQAVMLFLTDGERSSETRSPLEVASELNTGDSKMRIFTYSFGDGADVSEMKKLACQNQGVWQRVPDSGDLKQIMASYFMYLAAGLDTTKVDVRWSDWFEDGQGLGQIAAACGPVFDRTQSEKDGVAILFGVTCTSISKERWESYGDSKQEWALIEKQDSRCPQVYLNDEKLEVVRYRVSQESVCDQGSTLEKLKEKFGDADEETMHLIVGVVAGVIVIGLVVAAWKCCQKKKKKKPQGNQTPVQYGNTVPALHHTASVPVQHATAVPMAQVVSVHHPTGEV